MLTKLTDLTTYWLTCEKTASRWEKIESLLSDLKISKAIKINGKITTPYTVGIAEGHIIALKAGLMLNEPFLIIEDDVDINPAISKNDITIDVPECDALYLGTSTFGRIFNTTNIRGCIVCDEGEYFKPINMLGMHSILYVSKKYINASINYLQEFIDTNPIVHPDIGCDNIIAENLWRYNIKVCKVPIFYQNDGHTNVPTLTPLKPIC